ncbi:MAG: L,D-transpeptidase [Thermaerobacter sp.]|nr:L,D-transpeptidase [Thermaerobacter sp.]
MGRATLAAVSLCVCGLLSLGPASLPTAKSSPLPRRAAARAAAQPGKAHAPAAAIPPVLLLQEELAQLGYLPIAWDGHAFYYPEAEVPEPLLALFQPGVRTSLLTGALMTYEADHGLPAQQSPGPSVWKALRADIAAGRSAPHAYTYAYIDTRLPERIYIWSTAGVLTQSLANTGTAGAATPDGTHPVYLRLTFQVMRGINLNGTPYADPVYWISYFYGGDAVHGFVRAAYGYPQSLGCVEVPPSIAQRIYEELQIGSLVTVSSGPFQLSAAPAAERSRPRTPAPGGWMP